VLLLSLKVVIELLTVVFVFTHGMSGNFSKGGRKIHNFFAYLLPILL